MFLQLFITSLIFSVTFCSFQCTSLSLRWLNDSSVLFNATVIGIVFLLSFGDCSLLVYRNNRCKMLQVWSALCSQVCREAQEKGEGRGKLEQNGHETFYHFECDFFFSWVFPSLVVVDL